MICPICKTNLCWGGDDSYEDYEMEGDGIVSNSSCVNDQCDVDIVLIYSKFK
ncbi:MAG: hypothetical protein Unbinned2250contig1000_31 [Prokaryotic dsDNA virus sp.]|nr:MAG: hypothetical protein Unbinned2250contig1000_31 [Prokaryotic dsDNA virus sp.]|tara:strand:- start:5204 stop:5359 length:156 start_codon:yes stop_codon:yes gene_type:complete